MDIRFPFENAGKSFFGFVYRPIAKASFKSIKGNMWITIWMVVDSGADFTILPRYLSKDLEVSLETDCVKDTTVGVGGEQTLYLCKKKIKAKLGLYERSVPLAFLDSNEVPALLGRLGFLETFNTEFLKSHVVVFKD
jgi:hypothetical protein